MGSLNYHRILRGKIYCIRGGSEIPSYNPWLTPTQMDSLVSQTRHYINYNISQTGKQKHNLKLYELTNLGEYPWI